MNKELKSENLPSFQIKSPFRWVNLPKAFPCLLALGFAKNYTSTISCFINVHHHFPHCHWLWWWNEHCHFTIIFRIIYISSFKCSSLVNHNFRYHNCIKGQRDQNKNIIGIKKRFPIFFNANIYIHIYIWCRCPSVEGMPVCPSSDTPSITLKFCNMKGNNYHEFSASVPICFLWFGCNSDFGLEHWKILSSTIPFWLVQYPRCGPWPM